MLIDNPEILKSDPILEMLAALHGLSNSTTKIATGVYEIDHFGITGWPSNVKKDEKGYDVFYEYAVCDNWEQVAAHYAELLSSATDCHCVTLTRVVRAEQPPKGGWRWHKWGEYIGKHEPKCEYLYNEKGIDHVYVCHVYTLDPAYFNLRDLKK